MKIVILAPQGVQSLDVVGPAEVFWQAARRLGNADAYQIQIMGISDEPIRGTGALRFLPDRTIHDPDEPIDTLKLTRFGGVLKDLVQVGSAVAASLAAS